MLIAPERVGYAVVSSGRTERTYSLPDGVEIEPLADETPSGTRSGFDIELVRAVSESVSIPVIASSGAGTPEHFREVLTAGKADAALAASLFHYGELPIRSLKEYLASCGIPMRLG